MNIKNMYNGLMKEKLLPIGFAGYLFGIGGMQGISTYLEKSQAQASDNLARVLEMESELNKGLEKFKLKDLDQSLVNRVQNLKIEKDSLESLPNFYEEKEEYELEKKNFDIKLSYGVGGFGVISTLSMIPMLLGAYRRRKMKRKEERF